MIELTAHLPTAPTVSGMPARTPGQADFGDWLGPAAARAVTPPGPTPASPPAPTPASAPAPMPASAPAPTPASAPAPTPASPPAPTPASPPAPTPVVTAVPADAPAILSPGIEPAIDLPPVAIPSGVEIRLELNASQVAVESTVGASEPGPTLRLSAHQSGATVPLVVTQWQLAAGDRLSQHARSTSSSLPAAPPVALTAASGVGISDAPARAAGIPRTVASVDHAAGEGVANLFPAANTRQAAASAASGEAVAGSPASLGQAAQWPLRLLRWLNQGPDGETLWLRDFTLDPGATSALVNDLRRFASSENIPLQRIVLNGRTLWSVASFPRDIP